MTQNIRKKISPMSSSTVQNATGATTEPSLAASHGEREKIENTPMRAMAISRPMARAISLPLNHLAIALETVVPAISQPQPKSMNPSEAILALAGTDTHHESSQLSSPLPWK